jgi:hypothetical protein
MRAPFIVLCALAFCVGQAAAHSGNLSPGPLRPESIAGRPMKPNHPTGAGPHGFPECTLIGDNAWNFNSLDFVVDTEYEYLNQGEPSQGWMASYPFRCGYNPSGPLFFPVCPEHIASGGPGDTGYTNVDSYHLGSYYQVGLSSAPNTWTHNYRSPNSITVSFHIKSDNQGAAGNRIGWLYPTVLRKNGEFFFGADNSQLHGERVCFNIDDMADDYGPTTQGTNCGASAGVPNSGLGETSGVLSVSNDGTWAHFVFVFDSNFSQWHDGEYRVYADGDLVYSSTGIEGQINTPTSNDLVIGIPASYFSATRFHMDNLQMFDRAVTPAEAKRLNCDVPD